jgi:hypothetical protein
MSSNKDDKEKKEKQAQDLAELRKKQSASFNVLSDTNEKSGQTYLARCASITRIHSAAKAKKLLPLIKPVLFHEYKIKHSSAVKMMATHRYWASKSDGEKAVFCRLFSDDNKSILECVTRLALNCMDGKKDTGRFVDIDISERTVNVELDGPQEFIDLATISETAFKALVFGKPKTASKRKGKKLEQAETKIRDQAIIFRDIVVKYLPDKYVELMASRKDWDSVFTDLSDSSSESPGSADAVDNRASDVPLDVQGDIHANDGTTAKSIPESGDTTTLVPDAVDDTGSKVLEVAEETVDEADVEDSVIGSVDEAVEDTTDAAVDTMPSVSCGVQSDDVDLDDDHFIVGDRIKEVALETETDVKVKKTRSARNIAPSIGAHGNTPYAGGAF